MLIEFLKEPIRVDGKEFARDLRININEKKQMRLKVIFYDPNDGSSIPLDLTVLDFDTPRIEGLGFSLGLRGREGERNISFKLKLSLDILKKKWRLRGSFNNKDLDKSMSNISDIVTCIRDLL